MNVFGIDYQRTLSVICLREGHNAHDSPHSVGDGLRTVIPNVVLGNKLWGSRALLSAELGRLSGSEALAEEPWLDEPGAALFWGGLYQRLFSYIGRVRPTMEGGYQIVVGIQAADYQVAVNGVEQVCRTAGLNDTMYIPATDAVLCRWMVEQTTLEEREYLVTAVAVGDTSVLVRAYCIQCATGRSPQIVTAGEPVCLPRTGLAWWVMRTLELVHSRFNEPIPLGHELALRDAVIEFGAQLSRSGPSREVEWTGLFREHMYTPPKLTLRDCKAWPEVANLHLALPTAIQDTTIAVGGRAKPDLVILGGVGGVWPFAGIIIATAEPKLKVWQSHNPLEDVARGATWWPLVETANMGQLWKKSLLAPSRVADDPDRVAQPSVEPEAPRADLDRGILPPWKRRDLLGF